MLLCVWMGELRGLMQRARDGHETDRKHLFNYACCYSGKEREKYKVLLM